MAADDSFERSTEAIRTDASIRVRAATLEITTGPDAGSRARVDQPTFIIGSGTGADLRLSDPTVSREHVRLGLGPNGIHLRDEGSKNGTWANGMRLTDVVLTTDSAIDVGDTTMLLRLEAEGIDLPLSVRPSFGDAIGVSTAMRHLFSVLERAAASDVPVLLEGESGVGKEVLARAVHETSPRKAGPLVAVDCGAIPAALIESELFGYERGAFTGAVTARRGFFEQANGGTLFLDEIGELALALQPKLLRVLETHEVRPLGSAAARAVDVRIIAATNRRLSEAVRKDEFRRDLFYRLAVARVTIPPLRDRPEDVPPIARALLRRITDDPTRELPSDLAALLTSYSWPGNVRELRNVIQRYALLGVRDAGTLLDRSLHDASSADEDLSTLPYQDARQRAIERFERDYATRVLARAGGAPARAAELAGVGRSTFYRMLERLRLAEPDEKP